MERDTTQSLKMDRVLVVGAGLSGLFTAALLLRQGISPLIVDQKFGPDKSDDLLFLNKRSIDYLDLLDIDTRQYDQLEPLSKVRLRTGDAVDAVDLGFSTLADESGVELLFRVCKAKDLEQKLIAHLTSRACSIRWATQVQEVRESESGVHVSWEGSHNLFQWVVGADGAQGICRRALGIAQEPTQLKGSYVEGLVSHSSDTWAEEDPQRAFLPGLHQPKIASIYLVGTELLLAVPLRNAKKSYVLSSLPLTDQQDVSDLPLALNAAQARRLSSNLATRMSSRRCFLVGDAAHEYYPGTGLALNEAISDLYNLSWKLAGVAKGQLDKSILQTYHLERHPKQSKGSLYGVNQNFARFMRALRRAPMFAKPVLSWLFQSNARVAQQVRAQWLRGWMGQGAHVKHSPLSADYSGTGGLGSGQLFPLMGMYDERRREWKHTLDIFREHRLVLVVLGKVSDHLLQIWRQWIQQKYPQGLGLYYLPYSARNQLLFERFGIGPNSAQMVLVRPDLYIAYRTGALNTYLIDTYLEEVLGWKGLRRFEQV